MNERTKWAIYGFIYGVFFAIFAICYDYFITFHQNIDFYSVITHYHLLWIIFFAPILLGSTALFIGINRDKLKARIRLEQSISEIVTRFTGIYDFNDALNSTLADIGLQNNFNYISIFLLKNNTISGNTYEWCAEGLNSQIAILKNLFQNNYNWLTENLNKNGIIFIKDTTKISKEYTLEKELLNKINIKTLLVIPLISREKIIGFMSCNKIFHPGKWHEEDMILPRIFSEILSNVLEVNNYEQSLAAEKERLVVTLRSIGDGVIATDENRQVILMNKVAEDFTEWSQAEALGQPIEKVFDIRNKKTGLACSSPVEQVLKIGKIIGLVYDTVLVSKTGKEYYISSSAAPINDNQNNSLGVILIFRDVTLRRNNEENLLKLQKMESINNLAGGIAHDFNNLLTSILGNISIAKKSLHKDNEVYKILSDAEEVSLNARGLTRQLLTFSKNNAPITETTSIVDFLKEIVNFSLRGSKIKCNFFLDINSYFVELDKSQMTQVINNIIVNAEQAMPEGGDIEVHLENITFESNNNLALQKGNYVKITIKDFGIGIPQENLTKVFDPFFTTKEGGNGIGLSTSYSIIKKHGGTITAESQPGQGASFIIYLPASMHEILNKKEESKYINQKLRILIMDDEMAILQAGTRILTYLGHEVETSRNGKEAIAKYIKAKQENKPFNIVIMDLTIPGGMGGDKAIQELIKIDPDVKAVLSSGYFNTLDMTNYEKYGFKYFISKPYTIDELNNTLQKIL